MSKWMKVVLAGMFASLIPITVGIAVSSQASATLPPPPPIGTVYQAHAPCCQTIAIGHWPTTTAVLTTAALPPATYTVTANVFVVMQPSDADNCTLTSSNGTDVINGTGGSVGNGATESGTGAGGVYANAILTYTVVMKGLTGDTLAVNCTSKATPPITSYAAEVTLIATKVAKVVHNI